jgi:hypothetical protein
MVTKITSPIAAMEGRGFYNRHSSVQAAGIAAVLAPWEKVSRAVLVGQALRAEVGHGRPAGNLGQPPVT